MCKYHVVVQLDSLRALVKGELTFFQREVLCALIVIEVHARDVTKSLLEEGVKNVTDFQWMCQLRYSMTSDTLEMHFSNSV